MRSTSNAVAVCVAACVLVAVLAPPAAARQALGRLTGTVHDIAGQPIKGATIRAVNPGAVPAEFTTKTDGKGQWAMLGLRGGRWEVSAAAPGFETSTVVIPVSVLSPIPGIPFVLLGEASQSPLDQVDTMQLQADLRRAESLMAQERWDDAVEAYRAILVRVPQLDTVNLAIGRALRVKKDYAGAEASYGELLKRDARNQKAMLELGRTQHERGDLAAATATLERLIAIDGSTEQAAQARELLAVIRR